jgi:hypothetical protein
LAREGYDERDMAEAVKHEKDRQANLLLKSVRRMQHYNEEKYPMPLMFDKWRRFVQIRRLFRFWLGFADKRAEYIRSDLH